MANWIAIIPFAAISIHCKMLDKHLLVEKSSADDDFRNLIRVDVGSGSSVRKSMKAKVSHNDTETCSHSRTYQG